MCQGSIASKLIVNSDHLMGPVPQSLRICKRVFRIHLDDNFLTEYIQSVWEIFRLGGKEMIEILRTEK
jgi:hypothetical protein